MADWRASLFDRLNPDSGLEQDDKDKLMRQGLLGLAAGLLSQRGFGPGLAQGIQSGLLAMNEGTDSIQDRKYREQLMKSQMAGPAGLRQFEALAKAAGYQPGTEDYQRAAQVQLGTLGRASSAGGQIVEFKDNQGRDRVGVFNPRTMQIDLPDGTSYNPNTGMTSQPGITPPQMSSDPFASLHSNVPGLRVTSQFRTPEENARLPNAAPNSFHLTGQAIDLGTPNPQQRQQIGQWAAQNGYEVIDNYADGHVHLEPRGKPAANPFIGRRPEDQAAAVTAAEEAAKLSMLGQRNVLEAQGAGMSTAAQEAAKTAAMQARTGVEAEREAALARAKTEAEAQGQFLANLPQTIRTADETIALLDKALSHPGRSTATGVSSVADPRNFIPGTDARDFRVLLDQLGGRAFLEAYESLKGGGQITEIEGRKATEAMARLNTAQSDEEFEAALRELRTIAASGKERALKRAQKYGAEVSGGAPDVSAMSDEELLEALGG